MIYFICKHFSAGIYICLVNGCSSEADRVKQIKTDAKVNQVQTSKLIASLIAEKEKLLRDLDAANRSGTPADGLTYDGDYLFTVDTKPLVAL